MNKSDKSSIFKTSLLVALVSSAFGAHAAGLGKLTVYSAIGQPLNAEVTLTATTEELNSLSAKLASHEAFRDAGIEFMPALTGLRLSVAKLPAGKAVLRLTTDSPLNEPFLHFLVELNWTAGRMVREYTFLLDPPEMLQVARPAPQVAPVTRTDEPQAVAVKPMPAPAPVAAAMPAAKPAPRGEVRVKRGDTLSRIAREHKPETVSLDQMLVALFNGNREAFDGSNMNRLRAGKILKLPDAGEAASVNPHEARQMIVAQAADFNAYRRRLAEAAGASPVAAAEPQQQTAGKIRPLVEDKAPPAPVADKLEVSRTETTKAAGATVDKGRLEEELVSRDKALREASERIAQLEKNLENLKRLAELKSQAGAQMQQQAQAVAVESKPEPAPPKPPEPAPKPAEPAAPVAASQVEAAQPVAPAPEVAKPPVPTTPKPVAKKTPPPPPPPEPSFIEENPELVLGGGGIIALLLGYFGYNAWRRKKQAQAEDEQFDDAPGFLAEDESAKAVEPVSVVAPAMSGDDVSVLGDFSEGGALTTEESVDPVAEADVLMAYGRDRQAEDILLEGLKHDPARTAIHAKLLELYANRKDVDKFESVASGLHDLNNGQGPEWDRAKALARDLGIAGGLFGVAAAGVAAASATDLQEVGQQDQATAGQAVAESSVASPVPADVKAAAPVESEPASLDFDLDLGTTSMPAVEARVESAAAKSEAEPALGLDFDFDLGTPSIPETPPAASVAETVAAAPESGGGAVPEPADSNVIDFSLDLGETAEAPAVAAGPASEPPEVAAAADEIDFDLDLGQDVAPAVAASEDASVPPVAGAPDLPAVEAPQGIEDAGLDFDFGTEDVAMDAGEPASPAAADTDTDTELPVFDLGLADISLDLKLPEEGLSEAELPGSVAEDAVEAPSTGLAADAVEPAAGEVDLALPEMDLAAEPEAAAVAETDDPEVATKLELAQAYEEMGDRDGARELLNEVLSEGSAAQQAAARARLDQLEA